jgi:hypothetical protein
MDERFVVLACSTEANIASAIASEIGIEPFRADFLCLRRGRRSRQLRMQEAAITGKSSIRPTLA